MTDPGRPQLIVCTTCRAGRVLAEGETPPGALLLAALERLPHDVALRPSTCLANCERGCSGAIAMPGKWTYLLGHLSPELAPDLLAYAASYAASATGAVMPSRRAATLARMVVGRIPPLDAPA